MALRGDASGDSVSRTAGLMPIDGFTAMGWFKLAVDRNDYTTFICFGHATDANIYIVQTDSTGTNLQLYNAFGEGAPDQALTVGTWFHAAMVCRGVGTQLLELWYNGTLLQDEDSQAAPTAGKLWIGDNAFSEWLNGSWAAFKAWNVALSAEEIANEMRYYQPQRIANLNCWSPFRNTGEQTTDFSGNGNSWTVGGTLATEDGPPVTWGRFRRRETFSAAAGAPPPFPDQYMRLQQGLPHWGQTKVSSY